MVLRYAVKLQPRCSREGSFQMWAIFFLVSLENGPLLTSWMPHSWMQKKQLDFKMEHRNSSRVCSLLWPWAKRAWAGHRLLCESLGCWADLQILPFPTPELCDLSPRESSLSLCHLLDLFLWKMLTTPFSFSIAFFNGIQRDVSWPGSLP